MTGYDREKHFISLADWSAERILGVLELAAKLKDERARGVPHPILAGKTLAMIFQKSSTRTRVSFEVAMQHLGGHALMLSATEMQLGRGETVADTARVLSRYVDGIMARTYKHQDVIDHGPHDLQPGPYLFVSSELGLLPAPPAETRPAPARAARPLTVRRQLFPAAEASAGAYHAVAGRRTCGPGRDFGRGDRFQHGG